MSVRFFPLLEDSIKRALGNRLIILIFFIPAWANQLFNFLNPLQKIDFTKRFDAAALTRDINGLLLAGVLLVLLSSLLYLMGTAASIGFYCKKRGNGGSSMEAVSEGFDCLPGMFSINLLVSFLIAGVCTCLFLILLLPVVIGFFFGSGGSLVFLLIGFALFGIGAAFTVIAGQIVLNLAMRYFVLEDMGVIESIKAGYTRFRDTPGGMIVFWFKLTLFSFGFFIFYWALYAPVFGASVVLTEAPVKTPLYLALPGGVLLALIQAVFAVTLVNLWTGFFTAGYTFKAEEELYEVW